MLQMEVVEKIKTHFVFNTPPPPKIVGGKYVRAGHATDGNTIRRMCTACWVTKPTDTHTCNTDSFSTETMVTRTRGNITLYIHCRYCVSDMCDQHIHRTTQCVSQRLCHACLSSYCYKLLQHCALYITRTVKLHSTTALIRINWDGETSGYAENPGNWIFLCK
jgi:hypothetical protein